MTLRGSRGDGLLGRILDSGIDGGRDVFAGNGLGFDLGIVGVLLDVRHQAHLTRRAFEFVVQAQLEAGVTLFLVIDAAYYMRGELAVGIEPVSLGAEFDPIELQAAEAFRFLHRDPPLHPHEAGVARGGFFQPPIQFGSVEVQHACEHLGGDGGIGYEARIDANGIDRQALRERHAVAVVNRAARRVDFERIAHAGDRPAGRFQYGR